MHKILPALKILFICTHNRCRSILAEAIFNAVGIGLLEARSAGSAPERQVHPLTLQALARHGIATDGLNSKSWDDMEAFAPDVVVTVCDRAANESCPLWVGQTVKLHWGLRDPSAGEASDAEKKQAFDDTISKLRALASDVVAIIESDSPGTADILAELKKL